MLLRFYIYLFKWQANQGLEKLTEIFTARESPLEITNTQYICRNLVTFPKVYPLLNRL